MNASRFDTRRRGERHRRRAGAVWRGDGRGEFKIGPFHVTGTRSSGGGFGYQDDTKGTFKARSAIDGKLKITARGNNKRAAAHAKIHGANGFKGYDGKGKLQFSPGGGWNTLKVLDFKNGDKIYKFTTSKFRTYRLKIDRTNKHTGGAAGGITI